MARLWEDGFDHYGDDETNMLDGSYATANNLSLSTAQAATGTHSVTFSSSGSAGSSFGLRKVLPAAKDKMGAIGRFYFATMPSAADYVALFDFHTSSSTRSQITAILTANGAIDFRRGNLYGSSYTPGTLIASTDPLLVASAWQHVEIQVYIHDSAGWIRVAVNGVHRFQATDLDTAFNGDNIASVATQTLEGEGGVITWYLDDLQLYDFTGNSAVDTDWCPTTDGSGIATGYIGELQCMLMLANADTAQADFLKSTGTDGYPLIGKAAPDDATYIYSVSSGDVSEFALTDLPEEITYIRGLGFHSRLSKSDAGAALYKVGMKSVAATTDASEIPMTVEPTYWHAQINVDPNSSVRWTRASFNAAWLRQQRSA